MGHLSFHAGVEGKTKRKDVKGITGHTFRKSEDRYKNHGNKDIDKDKTKYNVDWTMDGRTVEEIVEDRIENEFKGKRALRKDAVVLREVIAQPSADMFEGLSMKEKRAKAVQFANDSLPWFREEFGKKNVVGLSVHMDETNPHVHFAIMPMTSDGRISQKDFFKGPTDLKRQHRSYREHMIERGWEFDMENKYGDVTKEPLDVYKRVAPKLEAKRKEHKEIMEDMARERMSDDAVEDLAVRLLLDESGDSLKEKLEVERAELELQREKFRERVKSENERLRELSDRVREQEKVLAMKEQRMAKMDAVMQAGVLTLLKGDDKTLKTYRIIEKEGLKRFKPEGLENVMALSIHRLNTGQRKPAGNRDFMRQQVARIEAEQDSDGIEL